MYCLYKVEPGIFAIALIAHTDTHGVTLREMHKKTVRNISKVCDYGHKKLGLELKQWGSSYQVCEELPALEKFPMSNKS